MESCKKGRNRSLVLDAVPTGIVNRANEAFTKMACWNKAFLQKYKKAVA